MRLYLVQHGQAQSKEVDPDRNLTDQGFEDVRNMATFLKPLALSVPKVWHSDKTRAAQTAGILAPALAGSAEVIERQGLAPKDSTDLVKDELARMNGDLMIVGHMPFLGKLAAALIVGRKTPGVVAFQQGAMVCLETGQGGRWAIRWMVVPQIL